MSRPHRRPTALALICMATAVLAACGSGDGQSLDGSPKSPSGPGKSTAPGHIIDVLSSLVTVNGSRAASGRDLPAGGILSTTEAGVASFAIGKKLSDCQIQPGSSLTVAPSSEQTLSFQQGTALCSTASGGTDTITIGVPNGTIQFQDPIFVVSILGGTTIVGVNRGFVMLQSSAGGVATAKLVGPGEQSSLAVGAVAPGTLQLFNSTLLAPTAQTAINRMVAAAGAPSFAFPDPGSSVGLLRIRKQGTVVLALDPTAGRQVQAFVTSFFAFLRDQWAVNPVIKTMSLADARAAVAQGTVDMVVSAGTVPGTTSAPFLTDSAAKTWSLRFPSADTGLQKAVQTFVGGTLQTGVYAARYTTAFNQPVAYETLRPLVLSPPITASSRATP